MKIFKCSRDAIEKSLEKVNEKFDGNICFHALYETKSYINVRLTVLSAKGKGARLSFPRTKRMKVTKSNIEEVFTQTKLKAACFHVHGTFFDYIFEQSPKCYIYSLGKKITKEKGNWTDFNQFQLRESFDIKTFKKVPERLYSFSDLCMCNKNERK